MISLLRFNAIDWKIMDKLNFNLTALKSNHSKINQINIEDKW